MFLLLFFPSGPLSLFLITLSPPPITYSLLSFCIVICLVCVIFNFFILHLFISLSPQLLPSEISIHPSSSFLLISLPLPCTPPDPPSPPSSSTVQWVAAVLTQQTAQELLTFNIAQHNIINAFCEVHGTIIRVWTQLFYSEKYTCRYVNTGLNTDVYCNVYQHTSRPSNSTTRRIIFKVTFMYNYVLNGCLLLPKTYGCGQKV